MGKALKWIFFAILAFLGFKFLTSAGESAAAAVEAKEKAKLADRGLDIIEMVVDRKV